MSDEPKPPSSPVGVRMGETSATTASRAAVSLLGLFVLVMLFAGLRPYASYSDSWVDFDDAGHSSVFGHYGLMTGELAPRFRTAIERRAFELSMNVRLLEPPDNRFQVLVQIGSPGSPDPLIVGQWRSQLIVMSGRDYRNERHRPRLSADLSGHVGTFVEIAVVLRPAESYLVVDRVVVADGPAMPFEERPTRITVGNAPDGGHGWTGELRALRLLSTLGDGTGARYELDRDTLPTIGGGDATDRTLNVPEPGDFPDRIGIGSMRLDELLESNRRDLVVNFVGFAPFGFLTCATWLLWHARRRAAARGFPVAIGGDGRAAGAVASVAVATLAGFLASLAIETLQTRIPGRSPHVHDLVLNTLGAAAGALALYLLCRATRATITGAPATTPTTRPG